MADVRPDWIAADWGTTHLRLWGVGGAGVLWQTVGPSPQAADWEDGLLAALGDQAGNARLEVLACGMVGARGGWAEAPYVRVPCPPLSAAPVRAPARSARLRVHLLGGLRQDSPADVMRGEETQIAGFVALNPGFDGILCLPGSHSKWAEISAGEVVSFRSFLTGELFAALSGHTVLRHTIPAEGWDAAAFHDAVGDTLSRPERLASGLFSLRAEALLSGLDGAAARARLSGILIGAELAATRPYWLGRSVAVIGDDRVAAPYLQALRLQGLAPLQVNGAEMALKGLMAAHTRLKGR